MARKLYYHIIDDSANQLGDDSWRDILSLQHWYNSEFSWTAGKLSLRRYIIFPNGDHPTMRNDEIVLKIRLMNTELKERGYPEDKIIDCLLDQQLIILKKGGYRDGSLASGFTRVAANEYNAYLTCEFLLHVSRIINNLRIVVEDEGEFVKLKHVIFQNGSAYLEASPDWPESFLHRLIETRRLFSIVDVEKYENFPEYKTSFPGFTSLKDTERNKILRDRSWLGFHDCYDANGDDFKGVDLNRKVKSFSLVA